MFAEIMENNYNSAKIIGEVLLGIFPLHKEVDFNTPFVDGKLKMDIEVDKVNREASVKFTIKIL